LNTFVMEPKKLKHVHVHIVCGGRFLSPCAQGRETLRETVWWKTPRSREG